MLGRLMYVRYDGSNAPQQRLQPECCFKVQQKMYATASNG
jgi:hypothetical protein